ncbi:MAG: DUF6252 family protein [Flavobacteriaceae bacterium]
MKTKILLFIALTLVLGCCSDDDNKPASETDKLPPATQTGANTAGCLVNGKAFLPKGYFPNGNLSCNYTNGSNFNIRISEKLGENITSVFVFINNQLVEGETYELVDYSQDIAYGVFTINTPPPPNPNFYNTTSIVTGEFTITHHDFDNAILSGTFWFDAVNSEGEIVEVREGRFDVEY